MGIYFLIKILLCKAKWFFAFLVALVILFANFLTCSYFFWNFSSFVPFCSFPWKNDIYLGTTPSLWAGRINTFLKKFVPFVPEKQRWGTIAQPYLPTFFSSILLLPIFPLTKELNLCHKFCKICNPLSYQRVTRTDCKDITD